MNHNSNNPGPDTARVVEPMADPGPVPEIAVQPFVENGCTITAVVIDPADRQQFLYGTVTRADGVFVGSYYPADIVRGKHWRIVTADGRHYHADSEQEAAATLVHTFATP